jgi:hypothetical protein
MLKWIIASVLISSIAACGLVSTATHPNLTPAPIPKSNGEAASGYTYIPIDPFAVQTIPGVGCKTPSAMPVTLLNALPDNAVRMLVETFDLSGNVTYGTSKAGAQFHNYRVTVDYINADTINVTVFAAKSMLNNKTGKSEYIEPISAAPSEYQPGSEVYEVYRFPPENNGNLRPYNIPVYIGIGLRVSANVYVTGASANISGIGVIGAEAEANTLTGSLIVQTLGINGKSVAAALPIQSELNRTTAENAITSVASIKTLLYADETIKAPRVVGLYLPFSGGQALVNSLISALSTAPVPWERPCTLSQGEVKSLTSATNNGPGQDTSSENPLPNKASNSAVGDTPKSNLSKSNKDSPVPSPSDQRTPAPAGPKSP